MFVARAIVGSIRENAGASRGKAAYRPERAEGAEICFGTSGLGGMPATYGYSVDEERARATVHAVFDGPANFIDTSRNYGLGRSEDGSGR